MKLSELIENYKRIAIFCDKTSTKSVILELQGLEKSQKPVVPQFVADWYEENKDDFEGNLYRCTHNIPSTFDGAKLNEFERWFLNASTKPFQTLVNMHQFGYEVEKEKRYKVVMKPEINSVWLHLKTGKRYKVVQVGLWEETLEKCVVYVSLDKNARCWIRPLEIFMDGRFKEVE